MRQRIYSQHFLDTLDPFSSDLAECAIRRLKAQLAEAAERTRRIERLSQVNPRDVLTARDLQLPTKIVLLKRAADLVLPPDLKPRLLIKTSIVAVNRNKRSRVFVTAANLCTTV